VPPNNGMHLTPLRGPRSLAFETEILPDGHYDL
jgi:hypothetical protein